MCLFWRKSTHKALLRHYEMFVCEAIKLTTPISLIKKKLIICLCLIVSSAAIGIAIRCRNEVSAKKPLTRLKRLLGTALIPLETRPNRSDQYLPLCHLNEIKPLSRTAAKYSDGIWLHYSYIIRMIKELVSERIEKNWFPRKQRRLHNATATVFSERLFTRNAY